MNLYKLHTQPEELVNYTKLFELGIYTDDVQSWKHWLELKQAGYRIILGNFNCSNSNLTSLNGSPTVVKGSFDCSNNKLTSLNGQPESIGKYFYVYGNNLKYENLSSEIAKYKNRLILE